MESNQQVEPLAESITIRDLKVGQSFYARYDKRGCRVDVPPSDPSRIMRFVGVTDSGVELVQRNGQVNLWINPNAPIMPCEI